MWLRSTFALALLVSTGCEGAAYPLPAPGDDLIGEERWVTARHEDTLPDIARAQSQGFDELVLANPGVDLWLPGAGTSVTVPSRYVLPAAPRKGIVVNVAEQRLYFFPESRRLKGEVHTYPISIGRENRETPLGLTRVVNRLRNPSWYPDKVRRAEAAARGEKLPWVVPPGPDNPLGPLALQLALPGYLIHGTNQPFGIGIPVTRGCLRLYPEEIERLFGDVRIGTRVRIVNQPVKTGFSGGVLFLEIHPALEAPVSFAEVEGAIAVATRERAYAPDWNAVNAVLLRDRGMPMPVPRAGVADALAFAPRKL